jgi:hypothetical protein
MCELSWQRLSGQATLLALLLCIPLTALAKEVAGWVEMAVIQPGGLEVRAKLDSGAETSSLHCTCSSTFQKDGKEWVRFTVENWRGETVRMEREVVRRTQIKRHFGASQERLVITLPICVGNVLKEREVNVVDRGGLEYQLLIGRNFMAGDLLIDPGRKYLLAPSCSDAPTQQ